MIDLNHLLVLTKDKQLGRIANGTTNNVIATPVQQGMEWAKGQKCMAWAKEGQGMH